VELISGFNNTVTVIAVHNKDKTLCVLEVMPPEGSDLVLTPDIPDSEANVLVLNGFNIETCILKANSVVRYKTEELNITVMSSQNKHKKNCNRQQHAC
jgi:hypothetical protein